jgi:hypothetical protein
LARTTWQLVTFCGEKGAESVGVVDLVAMRKDHRKVPPGMKRGDALQIVLIQVKGGQASMPTEEDGHRLRAVARRHRARAVLLFTWKKGKPPQFFRLRPSASGTARDWVAVTDIKPIFK